MLIIDSNSEPDENVGLSLTTNEEHNQWVVRNSASQPKQVLLPCHSLSYNRNRNFFGQKTALESIDMIFLPPELSSVSPEPDHEPVSNWTTALKAYAICGMGGLGKSEIAIEYVHSRKAKFDAIFWINGASTQKLDAGFREIATKLGLQSEEALLTDDPVAVRESVKGWLANPVRTLGGEVSEQQSDVRWLIVFDNIDEPDLLYEYWPPSNTGSILLTSRNPLAKQAHFAELAGIDLPPMIIEEASRFLQKASLREDEPASLETCSTIAEQLGGLPLAITQMGYLIRAKHLSLTEFLEYYMLDARKFHECSVPGLTEQQIVASTWSIESLPPSSVALLRILSMLDADVISEDILITGAKDVELEEYPQDKIAYFEAREALMRSSLISRNIELGFLKIHRLVQEVVRQKFDNAEFRAVYNGAVTLVTAVWPFLDDSNLNRVDRLRKVQRYFSHVMAFRSLLRAKTPATVLPDIKVSALFNEAAW